MRANLHMTTCAGVRLHFRAPPTQDHMIRLRLAMLYTDCEAMLDMLEELRVGAGDSLDSTMPPDELVSTCAQMLALAVLPEDDAKNIADLSQIIAGGGCECKLCSGGIKGRKPNAHEIKMCKYSTVPARASTLYGLAAPHKNALLDAHPALTAITGAINRGTARFHEGKRKSARIKQGVNEILGIG